MNINKIESYVRKIPDFPKKGILFYDISTLIADETAFKSSIEKLCACVEDYKFDKIAAIDARGFIFGAGMALHLNVGLIMIRKKNKLPGNTVSLDYQLEYGSDTLELNIDVKKKKILLIDDLLATGGTANAAIKLLKKSGSIVSCFATLIELNFLKGRENINIPVESIITY